MELKKLYKKNDDGTIRAATVEVGSQGEAEMKAIGFDETEPTDPDQTQTDHDQTAASTKSKASAKSAKAE